MFGPILNFVDHIKIACQDIREVTALNYDMTDSSNLNNVIEDKAVKLSKEEIEHFNNIKKEVELMTEQRDILLKVQVKIFERATSGKKS